MVFPGNSWKIFNVVNQGIFHLFVLYFLMVRWNSHLIILGWCEYVTHGYFIYSIIFVKKITPWK